MEIILKPIDKGPAIVIVERALNLLRDNPDGQTFSCNFEDGTLKLVVPLTEEQHSRLFMLPVSDGKPNQVKVSKAAPVKRKKKDSVRRIDYLRR